MIRLVLVGLAAFPVLALLLVGVVDAGLRSVEDFVAAGRGSRRSWMAIQFGAALVGIAVYLATGHDNRWLVAVPAAWAVGEAAYLLGMRPRLQRVRTVSRSRLVGRTLEYAALVAAACVLVFPLYITAVNSLLKAQQITHRPPSFFPFAPQWHSYVTAWTTGHMGRYVLNSIVMTAIIVVGQVVTSVTAAYAFAYLRFPFKRTLFVVFLGTLMLPFEVTVVVNLRTVSDLGLYNTYAGLALPFLATGFGAFLMRQAFLSLPFELHDAATIDGYGHLRFMTRIAVPLTRPSIAALTVFAFLGAWSQYLWPFLITRDDKLRTVQIGVKELRTTQLDQVNVVFAGLVIAAVPLVILLIVFQKQLIRGLTAGAVKG
ncbi:MAG: carbohydrate ABC transporter permease [Acidimicrobiales bacterium]